MDFLTNHMFTYIYKVGYHNFNDNGMQIGYHSLLNVTL